MNDSGGDQVFGIPSLGLVNAWTASDSAWPYSGRVEKLGGRHDPAQAMALDSAPF